MTPRLILFDIDGTLIKDDGASRGAYAAALAEVYDHADSLSRYDFSGRTDPQITHIVLADSGLGRETVEERLDALWVVYLRELERLADSTSVHALAGTAALLGVLSSDPNITLALLTGNIEPGARIKLAPPEFNGYFSFGAFGSDSADRNELPPIALQRAREATGLDFQWRDVVVIGDSIYDIRCGVAHAATTIGVASGKTSAGDLRNEQPDHLFGTLEPTEALLAAIRNS